jgi:predicted SprT family Zn-dependent metalloprotease
MTEFRKKLNSCVTLARKKYGDIITIPDAHKVIINREYMYKGWLAYESALKNLNLISLNNYYVDLNKELYIEEIIPHEFAHVICRLNPLELYSVNDHCENWAELCHSMGGSGEPFVPAHKVTEPR